MYIENQEVIECNNLIQELILWNLLLDEDYNSFEKLLEEEKRFTISSTGIKINENFLMQQWQVIYLMKIQSLEKDVKNFIEHSPIELVEYFGEELEKKIKDFKAKVPNSDAKCEELSTKISSLIDARPENGIMNQRIISLLSTMLTKEAKLTNVGIGLHNAKRLEIKAMNCSFYIKPFSGDSEIDPREPFLYKVLEYMKLGPKTIFLLGEDSSKLSNGSPAANNFIMTEEVKDLLLDGRMSSIGKGNGRTALHTSEYENFRKKKENIIKFSLAAVVKGLLSIDDIFPNNTENYGIVKLNESGDYDFMIIDHFPGGNGPIRSLVNEKSLRSYSPRQSTQSLCSGDENWYKGNLSDIKSSTEKKFADKILSQEVNHLLFTTDGNRKSIYEAIEEAHKNIQDLINKNEACFIENSIEDLQKYVDFIKETIDRFYKKTAYFKIYEGKAGGRTQ